MADLPEVIVIFGPTASGKTGAAVVRAANVPVLQFQGTAGTRYVLERVDAPIARFRFAAVTGAQAKTAKHLGNVQIGLD